MNISKAIKLCRNQKGFTKTKLAENANISVSYLTLLEQGKRDPNLSTLERICQALQVPTTVLMFLAADSDEKARMSTELSEKLAVLALSAIGNDDE
ncbi:helix-turn-helix domain-containing protein [Kingella kingae]|uniref:helix-turn-helix domain-containing protein n=1 Tax=Kingella kingae TaxID=504 RepID=UPI002549F5E6|nr:helix-turn-helix transcriptional regulator [Kingella kingae]MDK4536580.1 helix-turn-helix transcriptional regulator [Kingella kingae]MDK4539001.1 helix-turn-helix transcriptional regulator [Kingella kingae]MDK4547685.1 helix-turn-helix transcriptional regulator [Kingella kingae]MDK4623512.1 helix-turn-helix transcriptional regulator [Kingella kingae]